MASQPSLGGVGAAPPARDRLFFALYPDAPAAACCATLARRLRTELGLSGRPIAEARLHVTLQFIGSFAGLPTPVVDAARAAAARLDESCVAVGFDRIASFKGRPGDRPLVLLGSEGVASVKALRRRLRAALVPGSLAAARENPFAPHVTLLYDARGVDERLVAEISWTARELVLVHSVAGQGKHVTLGRWPLRG